MTSHYFQQGSAIKEDHPKVPSSIDRRASSFRAITFEVETAPLTNSPDRAARDFLAAKVAPRARFLLGHFEGAAAALEGHGVQVGDLVGADEAAHVAVQLEHLLRGA